MLLLLISHALGHQKLYRSIKKGPTELSLSKASFHSSKTFSRECWVLWFFWKPVSKPDKYGSRYLLIWLKIILLQTFKTCDSTGLWSILLKGSAFLKRVVTSAILSSSGNVLFLIELFIISVNIGKYVSPQSIRTFTRIWELMVDFFLLKDFMTFFTSSDVTSLK